MNSSNTIHVTSIIVPSVCVITYLVVIIISYYEISMLFLYTVGLMHGDMSQTERNEIIHAFKKKEMPVLVATDVAGKYIFSLILSIVSFLFVPIYH